MIAKLKGIVDTVAFQHVILDVQGVGYLVHCSQKTLDALPQAGAPTTLLIETVVREDALTLYGFQDAAEKDCFSLLTSVQGVGMKVGLAILSVLAPAEVYQAITHGENAAITRAEGVGPKLGARIVNELKDKVSKFYMTSVSRDATTMPINKDMEDAISALTSLGYKQSDIVSAFNALETKNLSAQDLIRNGLAQLSRRAS